MFQKLGDPFRKKLDNLSADALTIGDLPVGEPPAMSQCQGKVKWIPAAWRHSYSVCSPGASFCLPLEPVSAPASGFAHLGETQTDPSTLIIWVATLCDHVDAM